jgi:hypothetical protein
MSPSIPLGCTSSFLGAELDFPNPLFAGLHKALPRDIRRGDPLRQCFAASLPLTARAQQPAMPVVGRINGGFAGVKLGGSGYVEGQNVTVEYRWLDGQWDRMPRTWSAGAWP